jgi:CHAT domain-containing protein
VTFLAAHSALEVGRLEDARALFDALVAWPQLRFYRDVAWLVYYDLGRLALRRGDNRDVRRYYASSIEVVESMRRSISSDQGRIGFVAEKAAVYGAMIDFLAHKGEAEAALEYAERARSRALVDMLASRDSLAPRELPTAEAGERLRELSQAEGAAEVASALPPAQAATVAERATSQRARLASAAPSLAPLLSVQPLDLPALRNSIGADETAIAYFRTDSGWIAFVLTRTELYLVPLQASTMNRDVVALRETIQASHSDTDAWIEPAKRLHAVLLAPVLPLVHTRRLVIVPFGGLHYLPFAVLHDGTATLVQHYALRIVPSLTAIVTAAQNRHTGDGSLVIGNPDRRADAPALPNAEQEAVRVSRLLPAPELLLGSQATLNSFLTMAPRRAFVHVAGHGAFDAGAPLASRLLLTAGPGNNGDLTVAQLFEMRLSADLVTLSACQTALSKVESGDDVVGLVQGFLFAGARNVVASLWDVADAATSDLMASFYSNLRQSGSVPEALRTAQLSTMRAYPNPFYWAAFEAMSFTPIVEFRL